MARKRLSILLVAAVGLVLAATQTQAGEEALSKELKALNQLTGSEPVHGALKALIDGKEHAKELIKFALPAAKKKELSYNAALVLGLVSAELKDLKTAEVYVRICMDKAAKLQSFEKLKESYGLMIELYYDSKQYGDSARIAKELLELNTDDATERIVIPSGREPQEGFKTAQRLRPFVMEIYIKATAKQKKYDQAIKLVDNLLKGGKGDWIDEQLKGWVLNEAGKLEDSAKIYEDVIKKVTKDGRLEDDDKDRYIVQFRYEVSNVYIEMKKIDRATEHLEFLVKKRPDNPIFYNDLGYVLADNGMRLDEAEKLIRKAIDLDRERRKKRKDFDPKTDQDSGAYLDSLGWVLHKQKKNEEAKDWLLKAVADKNARHIEIYDHLGDVHVLLGEKEAAIRAYEKGLEFVNERRRDQELKLVVEKKLEKLKGSK